MAKARAKKATAEPKNVERLKTAEPLDPTKIHELLGLHGPYEPPPPPVPTKHYATWWDPGNSIRDTIKKQPGLFCRIGVEWLEGQAFAKLSDSWRWREIRLDAATPGRTYEQQAAELTDGSAPPLARELVAYLVILALSTGERPELPRLRCRDVLPSGRRVVVGPFRDSGLEIANVSERWTAPDMGLAALFTPLPPARKKR